MDAKLSQFHIKNAVSVKEVGYHQDKNYPSRQNMEDCTPDSTQIRCPWTISMEMALAFLEFLMGMEAAKFPNTVRKSFPMQIMCE